MSGGNRNVVLGLIVVIAIGAAGYLAFRTPKDKQEFPDDPTMATHWIDVQTGEHFAMTPAALARWDQEPNKLKRDSHGRLARPTAYFNPATNDYTIVSALQDPATQEWYAPMLPDGTEVMPPSMQQSGEK